MSYDIHINTFHSRGTTGKVQAVKVLEEAAEVFAAWQRGFREPFEDEVADCMQALANIADMYDVDLEAAMRRCDERNKARGRL